MQSTYQDSLYPLAFTFVKGIGPVIGRQILSFFHNSAEAFFRENDSALRHVPGITTTILESKKRTEIWQKAEKELRFAERNNIQLLACTEEDYPKRLKECVDAPLMLFYKGNADLNRQHILSVVGTRKPTPYGLQLCKELMEAFAQERPDLLICSGLAYGIDIVAHREALQNQLDTIGVLGHGLDMIYPSAHRHTAKEMISQGGLLSEFPSETGPDRPNFVMRNRIIAGMADATLVVESHEKGGSLITAAAADSYNRDIFAFPGRITDSSSRGCNNLIRNCKASLITSAHDLLYAMQWDITRKKAPVQRNLFIDLSQEEESIVKILTAQGDKHINQIALETQIPIHRLSGILLELEMKGVICALPGCLYRNI